MDLILPLLTGLAKTLQIAAGGILLAIVLSLLAGLGKLSSLPPIRWLAIAYIEVFRGTSALVQLFWFYFVLPVFGIELPAMLVGIVVLGLNSGAYGAEVVRGAIQSVPRGQWEAAIALNFSRYDTMRRVIIPQAVAIMLPPFGNIFIELLKNTALVSLITISELTFSAQTLRADTLRTTEIYLLVLVLYFIVAQVIAFAVKRAEAHFTRSRGMVPGR